MTALVYSESYQYYDFGPSHPLKPVRLVLAYELMRAYGMFDIGAKSGSDAAVRIIEPRPATDAELELVHDPRYIAKVKELSKPGADFSAGLGWGLGSGDNPVFAGMHEAAAMGAGGAIVAAEDVLGRNDGHVFHIGGGLHHALRDRASGFCIYNDPAIAISHIRQEHKMRVIYLDFDAHHGDGVQYAFYDDPEVLTLSFHESGMYLFPGTGFTNETGGQQARGYSVNLPLLPYTTDDIYLEAFDALVPEITRAFKPDIFVTQNGCDSHWSDPLSHLALTLTGFGELDERLHALAHEVSDGRWLGLGGGGYSAFSVVPRAWTILMSVMAEAQLPDELPAEWRELCADLDEGEAPQFLYGDAAPDIDAERHNAARDLALKGVEEIRQRVFPALGLQ